MKSFILLLSVYVGIAHAAPDGTLRFGAANSSYVSSQQTYFRDDAASQVSSVILDVNHLKERKLLTTSAQGSLQFVPVSEALYFDIKDLYVGVKKSDLEVSFGRRLQNWSHADELWHSGLWQPRAFHDKLNAPSLGLFGGFVNYKYKDFSVMAFASPLYIPEFGPESQVENGQIVSKNPWFSPPTEAVMWNNRLTEVRYSVATPNIEEVVMRPSYGASLGWAPGDYFFQASYADKPSNQMFLSFPVVIKTLPGEQFAEININPRFRRHRLSTVEGGYRPERGLQTLVSVTHEDIANDNSMPSTWISQDAKNAWLTVTSIGYNFSNTGVYLSTLTLAGGDEEDKGDLASENSLFERRYQYQKAFRLGLNQKRIKGIGRTSSAATSITYDQRQRALVGSATFVTQWDLNWSTYVQMDFLGLANVKTAEIDDGFIREYRANDRIALGASYVF